MKRVYFFLVLVIIALSFGNTFAASSIEGTVTYAGSKTGQVYVGYYKGPCGEGNVFSGDVIGPLGAPPVAYKLENLDDGGYCVGAFLDVAGVGYPPNLMDPIGFYNSVVTVPPSAADIDISLSDPGPLAGIWEGTADVTLQMLQTGSARAQENCSYRGAAEIYQYENLVLGPVQLTRISGSELCPDALEVFVAFNKSGDSLDGKASGIPGGPYEAGGSLSNNETTASGEVTGEYEGVQFVASWIMNKRMEEVLVPTMTSWGVLALALLFAGSSMWVLKRRKRGKAISQ